MARHVTTHGADFSIATMLPTRRQKTLALAIIALQLVSLAIIPPFASTQLVRLDGFVPSVESIIFVTDLATAVLLFSQYATIGAPEILILADGYLFSALMVVPHVLSYPGAFSPQGLLVAGLQGTPWIYTFWHLGFSTAVLVYACVKDRMPVKAARESSELSLVYGNAAAIGVLVCALTWLVATKEQYLPVLVTNEVKFAPLANYVTDITFATCLIGFIVLWIRQRSMLDLWLLVAASATVAEQGVVGVFISSRFSVGFYSSRIFSVAVSTIVLVALLSETIAIYARLARANGRLQRERDSKLLSVEVAVAAIAHEVRQPLTGISTKGAAARRFLTRDPPDVLRVQAILDEMVGASFRADEVIESIRALFRHVDREPQPVDLNDVTLEALQLLRKDFADRGIPIITQLTPDLPLVLGHKGQLREVVLNLVQNAVDAMTQAAETPATDRRPQLRVETGRQNSREVALWVEDSGPGIEGGSMSRIFDAFVTSKAKGMGLGLTIAQMIIERHNGQISVSSDVGQGSRFRVTLPIGLTSRSVPAAS